MKGKKRHWWDRPWFDARCLDCGARRGRVYTASAKGISAIGKAVFSERGSRTWTEKCPPCSGKEAR